MKKKKKLPEKQGKVESFLKWAVPLATLIKIIKDLLF